ncbi:MAG TPA: hypothetical protein DEB39_05660 [Planctomycetaceae bacterium]|nr:hypothetical protein [Planctomycetaceae bacterium]
MEKLTEQFDQFIERLGNSTSFHERLSQLKSVYPFSQYEYIISTLLAEKKLSFDEYLQLRDEYIDRNLFLYIFEITAPRGFGDTWALGHLRGIEPRLERPNKNIDATYRGEYDLYLNWKDARKCQHYIKIEVKASRANDRERGDAPLYIKALASGSDRPFLMNFQQMKPTCCDVFLWIAVYRDAIRYWVLDANAVRTHKDFIPQHRNETTAMRKKAYRKEDIFEGQIMMTEKNIHGFNEYRAAGTELRKAVIKRFKARHSIR